jgi:transposase
MPRRTFPADYRRKLVDLFRSGRSAESLAKEFDVNAQTIRNWARQADVDEGRRKGGLTSEEREELKRLRRENEVLREEREILKKAAAWFAQETNTTTSKKRSGS